MRDTTGSTSLNGAASARDAAFEQIEAVPLTERVTAALMAAFFSGKLRPGEAIVERQIAREMNVGTPVVREALITLKHQGFVRRISNKGSYVTSFEPDEVRQLYMLRIELETVALQWARSRVTEADLAHLSQLAGGLVEAGEAGNRREFLERDFEFHKFCWRLSGNNFLAESLERLMAPLFAFVVLASGAPLTASMGREHYAIVEALRSVPEPDFTALIRRTITGFAFRWIGIQTNAQPAAQ